MLVLCFCSNLCFDLSILAPFADTVVVQVARSRQTFICSDQLCGRAARCASECGL